MHNNPQIYQPYTYLLGWKSLDLWYYGVETKASGKAAHPSNLWVTYFSSSKVVKMLRRAYGEPDVIQPRKTFGNRDDAVAWEQKVLRRLKCVRSTRWINIAAYGSRDFSVDADTVKKRVSTRKKRSSCWHSPSTKDKISSANRGKQKNLTPEARSYRKNALAARNLYDETFKSMREQGCDRRWADPVKKQQQADLMRRVTHTPMAIAKSLATRNLPQNKAKTTEKATRIWQEGRGDAMKHGHSSYFSDPQNAEKHRQKTIERHQRARGWKTIVIDGHEFTTIAECAKHLNSCIRTVRERIRSGSLITR